MRFCYSKILIEILWQSPFEWNELPLACDQLQLTVNAKLAATSTYSRKRSARARVSIFESRSLLRDFRALCVCVCVMDGWPFSHADTNCDWFLARTLIHIDITILITEWHLLRKHIIIYHIFFVLLLFVGGYSWWFRFTFTAHDIHRKRQRWRRRRRRRRRQAPSNYAMRTIVYHFHVAALRFEFDHIRIMIIIY